MFAVILLLVVLADCCATAYLIGKHKELLGTCATLAAELAKVQVELDPISQVKG